MKPFFLFLFISFFFFSCEKEKASFSSLIQFIPSEAAVILKTDDLNDFHSALKKNSFLTDQPVSIQKILNKKIRVLQTFNVQDESLLCFSLLGRDIVYTLVTPYTADLTSIKKTAKGIEYGGHTIKKYSSEDQTFYTTVLNQVFVASSSKLILENTIRLFNHNIDKMASLRKVYDTTFGHVALFINNSTFKDFYRHFFPGNTTSFLKTLKGWTAFDVEINNNGISMNGVLMEPQSVKNIRDYFKGLRPQENELAKIVPMEALGFFSFTYADFLKLRDRLPSKNKIPAQIDGLFSSANEIGAIYFDKGQVVALNAKNVEKTQQSLLSQKKEIKKFRNQSIYAFSEENIFFDTFSPLLNTKNIKFHTKIGHFFLFSKDLNLLEKCIAHHKNGTSLANQPFFENTQEKLSGASSLLFVGLNNSLKQTVLKTVAESDREYIKNLNFQNFPVSALQLTQSEGFAHINFVFQKTNAQKQDQQVVQIMSLKLDHPLAENPQFFTYWRTGEQYIVAQDEENILYLFNWHGKRLWKKQLDGRILGQIRTVDIFKNKRLQMAFVTPSKFYIIDRNGKDVTPFPIDFSGTITQPLAIFDYANNRNYRFLITRDNRLNMLNNHGKEVSGFAFNQTKTKIVQPPKHIRIGRKDYILVSEKSGKLHILNRQGKTRIPVNEKIQFSNNPWFLRDGKFTSTSFDGKRVQINENGKVSYKDLKLSHNHNFVISKGVQVSISNNLLMINGEEIELDYGLYGRPQIFHTEKGIFIGITDMQTSKVYLFNAQGKLCGGFPVYGNSAMDLNNIDNKGRLEFTVKGEEDAILIYQIQ